MNRASKLLVLGFLLLPILRPVSADEPGMSPDAEAQELEDAKEAMKAEEPKAEMPAKQGRRKSVASVSRRAEGFIAGSDWQFDGFVAGGTDQNIKSLFAVNDLLYLNIGYAEGLASGDRLGIYRRGDRVRDPQTGRVIGYEVRKVGISEVTDRIEDNSCSARILRSFESVEIGDLVRRED